MFFSERESCALEFMKHMPYDDIDRRRTCREKSQNTIIIFVLFAEMQTSLEDFPQELLLILLGYLPAADIYKSLYHLNSRFDGLLRYFASSKLRLDKKSREAVHDPVITLVFAHTLFSGKISSQDRENTFIAQKISETHIIGSFSYSLWWSQGYYNIHNILQLCPRLEWFAMRYFEPWPLHKVQSSNVNWTTAQQFPLRHLELDESSFDTLYSILACCPKLLHLKFKITKYPEVTIFQQLAFNLTSFVPLLDCLHCSYIFNTDSQDSCDYRLADKKHILYQVHQMYRLFQDISCDDDYQHYPSEGGTSWNYQALHFKIIGGNQSVFFF